MAVNFFWVSIEEPGVIEFLLQQGFRETTPVTSPNKPRMSYYVDVQKKHFFETVTLPTCTLEQLKLYLAFPELRPLEFKPDF